MLVHVISFISDILDEKSLILNVEASFERC